MNAHCRIGRVKPKNNLVLLPSVEKPVYSVKENREILETLERHLEKMKGYPFKEPLAGCVVITWGSTGQYSLGWRLLENSPFGVTIMPTMIAEYLRREVAGIEAAVVMEEMFNGPDPDAA